jgi:DNA-binding SARP family transcriptional activator/tetratricopeptide (TPR) repeat protein
MDFRLLGPLEIEIAGQQVTVARRQERCVLAILLLEAYRPVPADRLAELTWAGHPPATARDVLQTYVSRLRRVLNQPGPPVPLLCRNNAYQLDVDPQMVDAHRFEQLLADATATDNNGERSRLLRSALALWRGSALADIGSETVRERLGARLDERRRVALDLRIAADLTEGRHAELVSELTELVARSPLDERMAGHLMLALHRADRLPDALDVYRSIQSTMREQLGLDPGEELQQLHRQILSADPALTLSRASAGASHNVPRQLPAPPQMFTGRVTELADLAKVHDVSTVVITAIDGMAGIGKTALAVQAAHQLADRYPDGQLFIDLHGYTQGVAPIEPGDALDRLLRALGIPGGQIPAGLDERAGLYRSKLADRRLLILLDNAATEAQLTPLLPGAPGCLVLVTSRRRLAGLDHTHTLSLETMPPPDAISLLRQTAGDSRLAGQSPELVGELVERCGRLPLAIRIAAARLRSHPTWDLAHLAQRLRDQQHRLVELEAGRRSVTAALDLSYQDLSTDLQRMYRLLGLHPGSQIDAYATAALLDSTLLEASRMLEQLLEAHLLQEPVPGRYRFHDLTRAHAASTASRDESEQEKRAAMDRLLAYYRHTAAVAMDAAYPYARGRRPQVPPIHTPCPTLADPMPALDWLDGELANLLAAVGYAAGDDRPVYLLDLSTIVHRHLRTHGHYHDAETLHQQALTAARATGHQAAEVAALTDLGQIRRLRGRYEQATDDYQQALQLARATGQQAAEMEALTGLGYIHLMQVRYERATDYYQQALAPARATGQEAAEMEALTGLGFIQMRQGRYQQATDYYQQALQLARNTGHRDGELQALIGLGWIHARQGWYEGATDYYQQTLQLARDTGHPRAEHAALTSLGNIHRLQGRYEQAADDYRRLLDLACASGDHNGQFEAWQGLGRLQVATGHPDTAVDYHDRALALATELSQPDDEARAHDGLAHAHHGVHQYEQARTHWQQALDILTRLGIQHTDDEETTIAAIRRHLASLGQHETTGRR